jgi:hypothetical protein
MLTTTYSFVALAAEQDTARGMLAKVQHCLRTAWASLHNLEALETALNKLMQLEKFCRRRKLEVYLIPALRRVTHEADALLSELDSLAESGLATLRSVRTQLAEHTELSRVRAGELWHALSVHCDHAAARLSREEQELLPLARRMLSIEEWFTIAAQFLSDDARQQGRRSPALQRPRSGPSPNIRAN